MLDRSGQPAGAAHERRPVSARRRRLLIVLSALLGWINHRFLKLPSTVALTMMGALASVVVIAVDRVLPQSDLAGIVGGFLEGIDFHET